MTNNIIVHLVAGLAWGLLSPLQAVDAQESGAARAPRPAVTAGSQDAGPALLTDRPEDERAIRAVGDRFKHSFAAGDAKAVAALFSEDAEFVNENGVREQGREAIEQFYQERFQARPQPTIEIAIESLRFLSPEVAKEEGHSRVKSSSEPETLRRYTVFFVKKEGRWLYSSVREEHSASVAHHEHLKPLEWLVGEWVDQSSDSTVHVSCRWSPDKNFLLRDFTVHVQGRPVMTVNERIGWDPLGKEIKSWVFDSEGGYGGASWTRKGNEWVVKSTGVLPDGRLASATHMLAPTGPNSARGPLQSARWAVRASPSRLNT